MQDRFKFRVWDKSEQKFIAVNCVDSLLIEMVEERYVLTQCTGLKDKNGRLIYEGDILEQPDDIKDYVYWSDGCYIHNGTAITNYDTCYQGDKWAKEVNTHKVIGNIYENPELLEANND